jgi:hypothetical protein
MQAHNRLLFMSLLLAAVGVRGTQQGQGLLVRESLSYSYGLECRSMRVECVAPAYVKCARMHACSPASNEVTMTLMAANLAIHSIQPVSPRMNTTARVTHESAVTST